MYITETERKICLKNPVLPSTQRYIYLCYQTYSERQVIFKRIANFSSIRTIYVESPFRFSEVTNIVTSYLGRYTTNRYIATPRPSNPAGARWCTYIPGAQILLLSVPASSLIQYYSERTNFVEQSQISQRWTCFPYTASDERKTSILISRVHEFDALDLHSSITIHSERSILLCIGSFFQIYIVVPHTELDERLTSCKIMEELAVNTVPTTLPINGIFSEITYVCHSLASHSERWYLASISAFTERLICQRIRIYDERFYTSISCSSIHIHAYPVIPARPEHSELQCFFSTIIYKTEVWTYAETRDLYVSKNPSSMSGSIVVKSSKDLVGAINLFSDRHLESMSALDQQSQKDLLSQRSMLYSEDSTFSISNTDTQGGKVSLDVEQVKTLVSTANFRLQLNVDYKKRMDLKWMLADFRVMEFSWTIATEKNVIISWNIM